MGNFETYKSHELLQLLEILEEEELYRIAVNYIEEKNKFVK